MCLYIYIFIDKDKLGFVCQAKPASGVDKRNIVRLMIPARNFVNI